MEADYPFPFDFLGRDIGKTASLEHHLVAPMKALLAGRASPEEERRRRLRVSFYPAQAGDVLMMFDLADREAFRKVDEEGKFLVRGFRQVLVPGHWLRRQLVSDKDLGLKEDKVVAVGSTRVDHLRGLMAGRSPKPADAPLTVLYAPLHRHRKERADTALSSAGDMAPFLKRLRARVADFRVEADPRNLPGKRPVTASLLDADIVITDCTSLIYEAWALGKPVLFPHWLMAGKLEERIPTSAEAYIYRERIGHHADSIEDMLAFLEHGRDLPLGEGVEAFMADYLVNWRDANAAQSTASVLENLAEPGYRARLSETRQTAASALEARDWPLAEQALRDVIVWLPQDARLHSGLARALRGQKRWWQEAIALETAIALRPSDGGFHYRLGIARQRLEDYPGAAASYAEAIRLAPESATSDWHYRLGYCLEHAGGEAAYRAACETDDQHDAGTFGVGALHAASGCWPEARAAYLARLSRFPDHAELHFRLGMTCDRRYDWAQAERHYLDALRIDGTRAPWRYRLGFVMERREDYEAAAEAYRHALRCARDHEPSWQYRLGYVLEKAGRLRDACEAYALAYVGTPDDTGSAYEALARKLETDCTCPDDWFRYSLCLEEAGRNDDALAAMRQAAMRSEEHHPEWYNRLGRLLTSLGRLEEACEAYRGQQILQRPHGVDEEKFETDIAVRQSATYREFHDFLPLAPKTILYESYSGVSLSCNPLAIFRKLSADPAYADWLHIWVAESLDIVPPDLKSARNVVFCTRGGLSYARWLASAQYLVNNSTFPSFYIRKEGQTYLNTWHGTPLKSLGADIIHPPLARANTARNFLQATHLLFPNEHTRSVQVDRYQVGSLLTARQEITGYPRIDSMLCASEEQKAEVRRQLGIDGSRPVVLYAPTFRGNMVSPDLESADVIDNIKTLEGEGYDFVFRGHYFTEKMIAELDLPVRVAPAAIDTCTLLSVVDVLVTDYSSIFFDFLAAGRPIIHITSDWEEYRSSRGVYFELDELPGRVCGDVAAARSAIDVAVAEPASFLSERYRAARARFCAHEDGRSTERAITLLFSSPETPPPRSRMLFYPGSLDKNGITGAALSLIRLLPESGIDATVLVNSTMIGSDEGRIGRLRWIGENVDTLIRTGVVQWSLEERWLNDTLNQGHDLTPEMLAIWRKGLRVDARRMVGTAQLDCVVDFDGYSPFTTNLFACMDAPHKLLVMHNDIEAERRSRFPHLKRSLYAYRDFTVIGTVSQEVRDRNLATFGAGVPDAEKRFVVIRNTIPGDEIQAQARMSLSGDPDFAAFRADKSFRVVNLARLSPEKNQTRLMDAVEILNARGVDISVYILGRGALLSELEQYRGRKGLENVRFLGLKENPFPYLAGADALVLSSDYEGQPLVILEAMALGVPCVSTRIPGPDGMLADGAGILTDPDPESLADGLERMARGGFSPPGFDFHSYNREVFSEFLMAVGRGRLD